MASVVGALRLSSGSATKAARKRAIFLEEERRSREASAGIGGGYKAGRSRFAHASGVSEARRNRRIYESKSSTFSGGNGGGGGGPSKSWSDLKASPTEAGVVTSGKASMAAGSATNLNENAGALRNFLGAAGQNLTNEFGGWGGVAKQAGKHALRGAVMGGAVGGVTESANGGSFWSGAKEGAFNGAVGWSAYRMAGRAVGATSRNPFSKDGLLTKGGEMYGGVSKQVQRIMQNKSGVAKAEQVMRTK